MSLLNNFSGCHSQKTGPRSALSFGSGRGVRFGEADRAWSGLPREPFRIDPDRVAIQRAFRFGVDASGKTVGIDWLGPEFVSSRRAAHLIETGQARFCGISGGEGK